MNTNTCKVEFTVGEIKISTRVGVPMLEGMQEKGKKVMMVNRAVSDIQKETGINLRDIIEDVHASAVVQYI